MMRSKKKLSINNIQERIQVTLAKRKINLRTHKESLISTTILFQIFLERITESVNVYLFQLF
jgi:hypothetical protein